MEQSKKWVLTEEEKTRFIDTLTPELVMLRNKAKISQDELSNMLGVSRQTYGAIERRARRMTWSTYLALVMFYDMNQKTHSLIRSIGAFPQALVNYFNKGQNQFEVSVDSFLPEEMSGIVERLDEKSLHAIRTVILLEYARCTGTPGEAVIMSFDGVNFSAKAKTEDADAAKAPKSGKRSKRKNGSA